MALSIKHPEADRLARELAETTGESLTDAVIASLRERLVRKTGRLRGAIMRAEIERMQERIARLPVLDDRSDEEILGFDDSGLPS